MAQRKYLIIIAFLPFISNANPWIPAVGKWKYSFELAKEFKPQAHELELAQYIKIKQSIFALEKDLERLKVKIDILKSQKQNPENKERLEIYKHHRIEDLSKLKRNLNNFLQKLNIDYRLGFFSHFIEYGLTEDVSIGISGNFSKSKFSHNDSMRVFGKFRLYEKKRKILSVRPYLYIYDSTPYPGIDILFGRSKKPLNKISKEIFGFSYFGIEKSENRVIYNLGNQVGSKILGNFIFLVELYQRLDPAASILYKNLLRKQYKIGKEFFAYESKFTITFGIYEKISLSARKSISKGISLGFWGEI